MVAVITGEDVKRWANPVTTRPRRVGRLLPGRGQGSLCRRARCRGGGREPIHRRRRARAGQRGVRAPAGGRHRRSSHQGRRSPSLRRENESNVILSKTYDWGDVDQVFADADHVVSETFFWNRVGANPLETFGCVSTWDTLNHSLTIHGVLSDAGVHGARASLLAEPSHEQGQGGQPSARWQLWRQRAGLAARRSPPFCPARRVAVP